MGVIRNKTEIGNFDKIEVTEEQGGSISLTYFGGTSDIGQVSSSNCYGLGYSSYIRNSKDIDRKINDVLETTWLKDENKLVLVQFLNEIKEKQITIQ